MKNKLNILAISGSLRSNSAHHAILQFLKDSHPEHDIVIYGNIESIPNFNPEKDNDAPTAPVTNFRDALGNADAVLICTPEYAYGIPGVLKNALDWTVSSGSFVNKSVGFITASGRGEHAHASLFLVLEALNAKTIEKATLLIPWFRTKMDNNNNIIDMETQQNIRHVLSSLIFTI